MDIQTAMAEMGHAARAASRAVASASGEQRNAGVDRDTGGDHRQPRNHSGG